MKYRRLLTKEVLIHTAFWAIYVMNEVVSYYIQVSDKYTFGSIVIKELVLHIPIIGIFYLNYSYLIPRYLLRRKHVIFAASWVLIFPLRWALYYLDSLFLDWYFSTGTFFIDYTYEVWPSIIFNTVFYLVTSTGARFSRDWFFNRKRIEELERRTREAELTLLQYQISPHFLFNTLNNIYSLVNKNPSAAAEAVLKFSNIMRYAMSDAFSERVLLNHEVEYLASFIELQRLRLPRPEIIQFDIVGETDSVEISPMLLIPFVENAFKHGDTISERAEIAIRLDIHNATVQLSVRNRLAEKKKDRIGGVGIPNVQRRLELIYPGKHTLQAGPHGEEYVVALKLDLS